MNNTFGLNAQAAAYYVNGSRAESLWYDLAREVVAGRVTEDAAVDALMTEWEDRWDDGDNDRYFDARMRFEERFSAIVERIQDGVALAPLAVVRPDVEAGVLLGLGMEPGQILTEKEVAAFLAGLRIDGSPVEGRRYAKEQQLPVNPRTGERGWSTPIGSYDFCPTPHKSVSVAFSFASPVEQARIFNAHTEAAREAVGYIADEIGRMGIGDKARDGWESGAVCWLEFTHTTSRRVQIETSSESGAAVVVDAGISGDPQLHTHFLISSNVFCPSGRVGSLDTMGIRGLIFEADAYYHARLGDKLRDAGFDAGLDDTTGAVSLPVVPHDICRLFSKRAEVGEQLAKKYTSDLGEDWNTLSEQQRVSRISNATKSLEQRANAGKDPVANFDDWRRQATEAGWSIPDSFLLVGPPLRDLTLEERHRTAYEMALPWLDERFQHEAVLTHFELRRAALRGLVHTGMDDLSDVDAVTKIMREEGVLLYGEKTPLVWGQEEGKRHVSVTVGLHERDEEEFVTLARGAARDKSGAIPAGLLKQKIETSGLDFTDAHGLSQRAAIERLGTGGRFGLVVASAGAGKSTALKPLCAAWSEMGRDIWGASLAWRQADDMVDAGIKKQHVKAFSVLIKGLDDGSIKLTDNSVVAVDEWGLLGTRQGLELLRHRDRLGFSIVALGDEKQCQAVEAGALIDLTRRALGTEQVPEILTTKRQVTDREKEIAGLLRDGRAAEALAMKREDGTAEMAYGGRDGVIRRVAELYIERLKETGSAPTISAPTNSDAHQISAAVRHERRKLGLVGERDLITVDSTDGSREYSLSLAKGDKVRLFQSTGARYANGGGGSIGRNGSVLKVLDANRDGITLQTKEGRVGTVAWTSLRPKGGGRIQLAYGDCMTIHSAQGSTAKEHILALPSGSQTITGHTAYSAATRHKSRAYLVTSEVAERIAVRESRPINDTHDVTLEDKWAQVAKRLAYQPERDTATAMRERVTKIKRGAVNAFHVLHTVADPRLRPKKQADRAPEIVQQRRMDVVLDKINRAINYVRDFSRHQSQSQGIER